MSWLLTLRALCITTLAYAPPCTTLLTLYNGAPRCATVAPRRALDLLLPRRPEPRAQSDGADQGARPRRAPRRRKRIVRVHRAQRALAGITPPSHRSPARSPFPDLASPCLLACAGPPRCRSSARYRLRARCFTHIYPVPVGARPRPRSVSCGRPTSRTPDCSAIYSGPIPTRTSCVASLIFLSLSLSLSLFRSLFVCVFLSRVLVVSSLWPTPFKGMRRGTRDNIVTRVCFARTHGRDQDSVRPVREPRRLGRPSVVAHGWWRLVPCVPLSPPAVRARLFSRSRALCLRARDNGGQVGWGENDRGVSFTFGEGVV